MGRSLVQEEKKKKLHTAHVIVSFTGKLNAIGKTKVTVKFCYVNDLPNPKTIVDKRSGTIFSFLIPMMDPELWVSADAKSRSNTSMGINEKKKKKSCFANTLLTAVYTTWYDCCHCCMAWLWLNLAENDAI